MSKTWSTVRVTIGVILALALMVIAVAWWLLRGSLPTLDGRIAAEVAGPQSDVIIERDADGAPSVRGENLADVAYGLGFLHAQDRYFQMDLSRRMAAGELSALVGSRALELDRSARLFRLRQVARQVVADATPAQREWLEAYTRGVNAGLAALDTRPWEYLVLRTKPLPWRAEDSILVIHSMWWALQYQSLLDEIGRRHIVRRVEERVAAASSDEADVRPATEVLRFLFPRGDEWDTPNFATLEEAAAVNGGEPYRAPMVPPPELLDLRKGDSVVAPAVARNPPAERELPGSNAWAVAGVHTRSGAALVAGDMHLGLRVPSTWYRARLQTRQTAGGPLELNGVTLPGLPGVVAGSNGHLAWSFTNSYGDWGDVQPVGCDSARNRYTTALGERDFQVVKEIIEVAGADSETLEIRESPFGVLLRVDRPQSAAAGAGATADEETCWMVRWLVTERGATTVSAYELQQTRSLDELLALAPSVGMPHQNLTAGDRSGRIAWTIIGRIPEGDQGPQTPRPIRWRRAGEVPVIRDPQIGRLWSANARHVEGPMEYLIGNDEADGGMHYDKGVRQRQIRDGLLALQQPATTADMLAIQLDDRALFLERWQRLLLGVLDEDAVRNQPTRAELRRWVSDWQGRAAVESVSYRLVRDFRERTRGAVWDMLASALGAGSGSTPFPLFEGSLWRLVTEQPAHLLPAAQGDWRSFLLKQADEVIREAQSACGTFDRCTWGARNTTAIRHPLSGSLGPLARFLDMPARAINGDMNMPRVTGANFGASERFAVSPGRETEAYLQIPGGQSGHPLSPFYRAGYEDWVSGKPRPLLPGPAVHTLTLGAASRDSAATRGNAP